MKKEILQSIENTERLLKAAQKEQDAGVVRFAEMKLASLRAMLDNVNRKA